jgi:hypothetical protein
VDLRHVPDVEFVLDQEPMFVLETLTLGLRRRVDAPLVRGTEFSNMLVLCEELDGLFALGPYCEGSKERSLPFDRDGGMVEGLLGHSGADGGEP